MDTQRYITQLIKFISLVIGKICVYFSSLDGIYSRLQLNCSLIENVAVNMRTENSWMLPVTVVHQETENKEKMRQLIMKNCFVLVVY